MASEDKLLRTLVETSPAAMLVMCDGHITLDNAAARQLLGSDDTLIGQPMANFWPEKQPDGRLSHQVWQARATIALNGESGKSFAWSFQNCANGVVPAEVALTTPGEDDVLCLTVNQQVNEPTAVSEVEKEKEALAIVREVTEILYHTRELQSILDKTIKILRDFSHAHSIALFTLDEDNDSLTLVASHGFSDSVLKVGGQLPLAGSLTGMAVKQRKTITTASLQNDNRLEPDVKAALVKQGLQGTVISVPLFFHDEVFGAMNLLYEESHPMTDWEQQTLLDIGRTISIAMNNAKHLQTIEKEVEKHKRNEDLKRLRLEMSQSLTIAETEEDIIGLMIEKASYYPEAAVLISVEEGEGLNITLDGAGDVRNFVRGTAEFDSGIPISNMMPIGTVLNAESFSTAKYFNPYDAFISPNLLTDERIDDDLKEIAELTGARSLAVIPLISAGLWMGNMTLIAKEEDFFTEERMVHYQVLTEQGSISLRASRLSTAIETSLARRTSQVRLSTQVAQAIAAAADINDLYERVVTEIKEQFDFYHTQILRYDPGMDHMALVTGYGDIGEQMLTVNHSMPMGVGIIGMAAATGRSLLNRNVRQDSSWQPNPLLPDTQSELAVPIMLGNQVLGVLDIQSDKIDGLTEDDQLLMEGLCGQIAVAIDTTRMRQEMDAQLKELRTLQSFVSRDAWEQYRTRKKLSLGYEYDLAGIKVLEEVMAAAQKSTQTANNGADATAVQAPLTVRGERIGILAVDNSEERPLTEDELAFIDAVSEQVAEALEAARLLEQTQESLMEQERLSQELETVAQVSTAASTILEADNLLQSVVDLTKASFDLYHAQVYMLDESGDTLVLRAGAGNVGRLLVLEGHYIDVNAKSIVSRAVRTRKGIIENDARQSKDFMPNPHLPHTCSEMAVPMIVGDKVIGALDLQSDQTDYFSEEDLKIHRTLSSQIAVAFQNAMLYATQVETAKKLRTVDQLKSEFLASMSHELRTPLNSIIGFADVLLEGLDGELNERMAEDVRLIRESGHHLRNLIGDILDMSKIEAGRMELRYEDVDMCQLSKDIIATAQPLANEKNLELINEVEDIGTVEADRTRLRQVLWNIMGNAIKFTEKGSVTLSMAVQDDDFLLVKIKDTGIGIDPANVELVFEQFRQVDSGLNRATGGTGLGMPISKNLVELHGGDIWVESVVGEGSTFHFTIPVRRPRIRKKGTEELVQP